MVAVAVVVVCSVPCEGLKDVDGRCWWSGEESGCVWW